MRNDGQAFDRAWDFRGGLRNRWHNLPLQDMEGERMNFQRGFVWDGGEGIVTATGKRIFAAARDKDREDS